MLSTIGKRSEEGKMLSVQAENSDRGGRPSYFYDEKISEEEVESERRSTPPGTIGES